MHPIARMMKWYFKMPLKYALPLLFIGALVLSATTGCVQQETTSTVGGNASAGGGSSASMAAIANQVPYLSSLKPNSGYKYVAYDATVKNINAKSRWISASNWQLRDTSGGVYTVASPTYSLDIKEFKSVDSHPGDTVNGVIIFEVPQSASPTSLTYDDGSYMATLNV
jgi:hypothetical protein